MMPVCVFGKDVVSHNKKMNKKNKSSKEELAVGDTLGIKGLSKGKRKKLEAYQHLFYLLQVKPWFTPLKPFTQCTQAKRFS